KQYRKNNVYQINNREHPMRIKTLLRFFNAMLCLCIVIIFTPIFLFESYEVHPAIDWTVTSLGWPIVVSMLLLSSYMYLRYLKRLEKVRYRNKVLEHGRTLLRIVG